MGNEASVLEPKLTEAEELRQVEFIANFVDKAGRPGVKYTIRFDKDSDDGGEIIRLASVRNDGATRCEYTLKKTTRPGLVALEEAKRAAETRSETAKQEITRGEELLAERLLEISLRYDLPDERILIAFETDPVDGFEIVKFTHIRFDQFTLNETRICTTMKKCWKGAEYGPSCYFNSHP